MPRIFISYRRADSRWPAARIYDRMAEAFGKDNIFKDVDNIPLGSDFRGVITEAVNQSDVILVVIGPNWLTVTDEHGSRRLDNPDDFVRLEVQTALWRQSALTIPVLVDNAHMPRPADLPDALRELAFRSATNVREDPDFHNDVTRLIDALNKHFGNETAALTPSAPVNFNLNAGIARYYQSLEDKAWQTAREILAEIRASGKSSRVFDLDQAERDVWDAEQQEKAEEEYNVLRLMAVRAKPLRVWERLQIFWETYPGYDPDNLADKIRPNSPLPAQRSGEAASDSSERGVRADTDIQQNINQISGGTVIGTQINNYGESPVGAHGNAPASRKRSLDLLPAPFAWIEIPGKKGKQWKAAPFAIAKYPLTNDQFRLFVEDGGYLKRQWWTEAGWDAREQGWIYDNGWKASGKAWTEPRYWRDRKWNGAEQPVVGVSWYEAVAFCLWLSDTTGEKIMLPTEDQWQYAAQGDDGRDYPWGKAWDCQKCNNSVKPCHSDVTTPVRQYEGKGDSPFGVVDMAGNVWEWCLTDYNKKTNDMNSSAEYRVRRGGWWDYLNSAYFRCDFRFWNYPNNGGNGRGFRLALSK